MGIGSNRLLKRVGLVSCKYRHGSIVFQMCVLFCVVFFSVGFLTRESNAIIKDLRDKYTRLSATAFGR